MKEEKIKEIEEFKVQEIASYVEYIARIEAEEDHGFVASGSLLPFGKSRYIKKVIIATDDKKIQKIIKRIFDFILAPVLLVCASPFFVIAMVVVKINSPGNSIFFKQVRSGYRSKLFTMYKLKTMTDEKDANGDLLPDAQRLKTWGKIIRKMSIDEILTEHPKGTEYAHLMADLDVYPVILDSNDDILSFPPIINGDHTTVTASTTDFFIDVTGWNERSCEACLLLVCLSLAERGGSVESVQVTGCDGKVRLTPVGEAREHRISDRLIERILGLSLESEQIAKAINRMGGQLLASRAVTDGVERGERWADLVVGEREHVIAMPRWRSDIMHPVDVIEDIAIGYGYENMPRILSKVHMDAIPLKSSDLHRRARQSLRSLNLQETQSLTLSCERDQFGSVRWNPKGGVTKMTNPITKDHTILRQHILPSLLQLLSANRHHELPQRVYELGTVVIDARNKSRAAWACAEVDAGFAAAKGLVQALLRDLGADLSEVVWEALPAGEGPWIVGRGARVLLDGVEIGQFGEVDPAVSSEFGLRVPIQAGDFDIDALGQIIPDPVL